MTTANVEEDLDAMIDEHRNAWLRTAEATLAGLDPRGFTAGPLAVIDFRALGAPAAGHLGFTAGAELHELARDFIPPGAAVAVAVNVDRIASTRSAGTVETIGHAITVIAGHELAHVLDDQARGERLPAGATLEQVLRSLTDGRARDDAHRRRSHGPGWCRAYLHLLARAAGLPSRGAWIEGFIRDAAAVLPHPGDAYFDALYPELVSTRVDARLVDVLRSPAPAGFLSLFTPSTLDAIQGKES